ncbi:COX15/CtaA family protein [soil metagenome]
MNPVAGLWSRLRKGGTRFVAWLPDSVDRRVRVAAWASLIIQVILVGTGGAVRLTGSGLGCPTWPYCTSDSFTTTPEMGIHGIIEFTNRALTGVVVIIAIVAFVLVLRIRVQRRELFVLTLLQGLSIPLQAVVGGITVLTGLNSWVVGLHFVISLLLVVDTAILVYRVYNGTRGGISLASLWLRALTYVAAVLAAVTVVFGIITTGSGPHAGDARTPRNGFDPVVLEHVHSWPAYALVVVTIAIVVGTFVTGSAHTFRFALGLVFVEAVQVVVGLTQARIGLPPALVVTHMVLAASLVAVMTTTVLSLRAPAAPALRI